MKSFDTVEEKGDAMKRKCKTHSIKQLKRFLLSKIVIFSLFTILYFLYSIFLLKPNKEQSSLDNILNIFVP